MSLARLGVALGLLRAVVRAHRLPPQAGAERLIGQVGVALTPLAPEGQVRVGLERWSAVSVAGGVDAGQAVRVVGVAGVRLQVAPEDEPADQSATGG
jgi:membrane-bound ClpP family serine protease